MKHEENLFDHTFKIRFENDQVTPPPALWDGVSARLDKKERERRWSILKFMNTLLLLCGLGAALWLLWFG